MRQYRKNSRSSIRASGGSGRRRRPRPGRPSATRRSTPVLPRARRDFRADEVFITEPQRVPQTQPDKMRHLVNKDPWKLGACAIERDPPVPQKRTGVHGPAAVPQAGCGFDPYRGAGQRRHSSQNGGDEGWAADERR